MSIFANENLYFYLRITVPKSSCLSMINGEIETAVLSLPLRIADRIWDRIETESEEYAEIITQLRQRINSDEVDGPSALSDAMNPHI